MENNRIVINKKFAITGALICGVAIILGAFGAHALKSIVGPSTVETWVLGNRYQMFHGLAILIISLFPSKSFLQTVFRLMILGIVFFSGSLYLLTFKSILTDSALNIIGPITPIGGVLLIASWFYLAYSIYKNY
jgi:uncharacterized membrane protein YgdD (TMEM256/DUF423 family)